MMNQYRIVTRYLALLAACSILGPAAVAEQAERDVSRPNVLLIVCDDLNDYVTGLNGHPQARTPHIERLAETGVSFTRAYSNYPLCVPSRASFLTGIYPHTSKSKWGEKWYENEVLRNSRTLMNHFKQNGYFVTGTGKMMHHLREEEWTAFKNKADYGPFWSKNGELAAHPGVPEPYASIGCVDGSYGALEDVPAPEKRADGEGWVTGAWGSPRKPLTDQDPTPDERNAAWAASEIKRLAEADAGKPFFLGVGFVRPHTPLVVPQKYFDLFPADEVQLPLIKENDLADTHLQSVDAVNMGFKLFRLLKESSGGTLEELRAFTRAYLASVAAVDDCIGQVLNALHNSPFKDNTIVVVTSDHGWSMGQKDWLHKCTLWEESCRIPLIIHAPGITPAGRQAGHPVSLIDLYPTLADLCGLDGHTRRNAQGADLEGHSMRPFLENPENGVWDGPDAALTTIHAGNEYDGVPEMQHYSLRTRDFRYIRYNNGKEELYDHRQDPREWTNLEGNPEYESKRTHFRKQLETMTGLKVGVPPQRDPLPIEEGPLLFTFEDFDPGVAIAAYPQKEFTVAVTRDPDEVIDGAASLKLSSADGPWNMATFQEIQIPAGMSCDISFDCRAINPDEGGYLYYTAKQGLAKTPLKRVNLAEDGITRVTDRITNHTVSTLTLIIGFHKGGTYIIDNLNLNPVTEH